jgi:hypothetical protein
MLGMDHDSKAGNHDGSVSLPFGSDSSSSAAGPDRSLSLICAIVYLQQLSKWLRWHLNAKCDHRKQSQASPNHAAAKPHAAKMPN